MRITKSYMSLFVIVISVVALTTVSAVPEIEIENDTALYDGSVFDDSTRAEYSTLPNIFIDLNLAFYESGGTCKDSLLADSVQLSFVPNGCCIASPHSDCSFDLQCVGEGGRCVKGCPF